MTVSESWVQVKGAQRSFQASMKRSMAAMSSATAGKLARHSAVGDDPEEDLDQIQP